jgi:hypothetical protein
VRVEVLKMSAVSSMVRSLVIGRTRMVLVMCVAAFEVGLVGGSEARINLFPLPGTPSICCCGDRRERRLGSAESARGLVVVDRAMTDYEMSTGRTAACSAFFEDTHLSPILRPGMRPFSRRW